MVTAKEAIESLYNSVCVIYCLTHTFDSDTKRQIIVKTVRYENVRCRLSYKTLSAAGNGYASETVQPIKLFISPDLDVPAGCYAEVTGLTDAAFTETVKYKYSGVSARYPSHQELVLELEEQYV